MLKCFRQRYPEIHITLIHGNYSEVEKHITSGTVDCGFLSVSPKTAVTYKVLFREKLYVILPPQHELAKKDRLFLKDLEGYEFIMPGEGPNHQVGDLIQKNDLHLNIKYAISDDDITVALISQGLGITILPELSYKDYLNFKIVSRELSENPFREIGIAYTSWDNISPIGKVFIKFVKNYFLGKNQADENAKNIGSR
jgi:DNA-binding transcriptional LysR family regulator